MKKLGALVLAFVLLTGVVTIHFTRTFDPHITMYRWPYKKKIAFTVSCDDISAGYPLEYLEEIQSIFETFNVKATFFVIPYHGEWDLLTNSSSFVEALQKAEIHGHEIGLHGYAHYEDEFVCSPEEQRQLLEKASLIMAKAGLTVKGFRAPCLESTAETQAILKEYKFVYDSSIFGESGISFEGGLPEIASGFEYTWYITEVDLPGKLAKAKQDFTIQYEEGTVFSLVTHMKAVNEGEGIPFLEDFLSFVTEKEVWNATLLELAEWELQRQHITWESRKTLTGGEITFHDVPEGLVVEICLPSHYTVKELPQGIEVSAHREGENQIFELTFHQHIEEVLLSFALTYAPNHTNEVLIMCGPSYADREDLIGLKTFLDSWEIPYRVAEVDSYISADLLSNSSIILVDRKFLDRPLTAKEKVLFYFLKDRVIILSGFTLGYPGFTTREEDLNYIALPLEAKVIDKGLDLGYYTVRMLKRRNTATYITIEKLRDDSPQGLYYNILVRSLFVCGTPLRKPFFSLEIDDCAMYETYTRQKEYVVAGVQAYQNSLDLARSYTITPLYGFTTSYFSYNPEIEDIFSLLKKNNVLVASHGYAHSLNFADSEVLSREITQANTDIEVMWGEPPRVILVPCHKMQQESMVEALKGTPVQVVGAVDNGYTFGVFHRVLFYERTTLQIYSNAVDAPLFSSLVLYSKPVLPSFYVVTHIFNYIKKESAYQYIDDALAYLVNIGYSPSDTETMAEEDFFWDFVDLKSFKKGDVTVIELSGLENLPPREYTIHFMIYGSCQFTVAAPEYCAESHAEVTGDITWVTVILRPEIHTRMKVFAERIGTQESDIFLMFLLSFLAFL